jgi:hypothetical protein
VSFRLKAEATRQLGLAYARASLGIATHRSNHLLTVSEASTRDILRYFPRSPAAP